MFNPKVNNLMMKGCAHNLRVILNVAWMGRGLLENYMWLSSGKCLFILSTGHLNWNNGQQKSHIKSVTWIKHILKVSLPRPKCFD